MAAYGKLMVVSTQIGGRSAGNSLKSSLCGAHAYRISELATSQPSYTQFRDLVPGHAYGAWPLHGKLALHTNN